MGRQCTICQHDERDAIDRALVSRTAYRNLTRLYGISKYALSRHLNEHILPHVARLRALEDEDRAASLNDRILRLTTETREILEQVKAGPDKDLELALKAITRLERQLELEAKIEQVISDGTNISLELNPQWIELRAVIIAALEPHPAARAAVIEAITNGSGN